MEAPVRMKLMVTSVCVLQDFWVSLVINGQEKEHVTHGTFKNIWTSRYHNLSMKQYLKHSVIFHNYGHSS